MLIKDSILKSQLVLLLEERGLPTKGTKPSMMARLQMSYLNWNDYDKKDEMAVLKHFTQTKDGLSAECKAQGLSHDGTCAELRRRLVEAAMHRAHDSADAITVIDVNADTKPAANTTTHEKVATTTTTPVHKDKQSAPEKITTTKITTVKHDDNVTKIKTSHNVVLEIPFVDEDVASASSSQSFTSLQSEISDDRDQIRSTPISRRTSFSTPKAAEAHIKPRSSSRPRSHSHSHSRSPSLTYKQQSRIAPLIKDLHAAAESNNAQDLVQHSLSLLLLSLQTARYYLDGKELESLNGIMAVRLETILALL